MLVAQLIERLQAMPDTARVVVLALDQDEPVTIEFLEYSSGKVQVYLDYDFTDAVEASFDEEPDVLCKDHPLFPHWRLRWIDLGLAEGYPLCCVLFFAFVWQQAMNRALRSPQGRFARLLNRWPTPNRYGCILCPWHRLFVPRTEAERLTIIRGHERPPSGKGW